MEMPWDGAYFQTFVNFLKRIARLHLQASYLMTEVL